SLSCHRSSSECLSLKLSCLTSGVQSSTVTVIATVPDTLGSVIGSLSSASGTLTRTGYLPYGKSGGAGPFGYTGQRIDSETNGLYNYRARHYSPALGRFLQADPIGYAGGAHLYAYVNNDPLNLTDPTGLTADGFGNGFRGIVNPNPVDLLSTLENYFGSDNNSSGSGKAGVAAGIASAIIYTNVVSIGASASVAKGTPTSPVINPAGAIRAAQFGEMQGRASLSETVANVSGTNPTITYTASGKTIYANPETGLQVVYDNAGNYFRVENTNVTGALRYTDQYGNAIPANVPLVKPSGSTQTGVPPEVRRALTHFNNTD
ncbi:RHS repeat-associated core domain-containing protein, partial [Bradyrhizobium manausense]|uniref:RHS repeat-associated core domain-containing protein n=1 Tax=Bradyrhizobium manausense TaxID=989370 RepID=UPI001BABA203